jgi:hypothetical protein
MFNPPHSARAAKEKLFNDKPEPTKSSITVSAKFSIAGCMLQGSEHMKHK